MKGLSPPRPPPHPRQIVRKRVVSGSENRALLRRSLLGTKRAFDKALNGSVRSAWTGTFAPAHGSSPNRETGARSREKIPVLVLRLDFSALWLGRQQSPGERRRLLPSAHGPVLIRGGSFWNIPGSSSALGTDRVAATLPCG